MYRSDKQFMKNPATAPMRIYIGNLADAVVPENLEERFKPHGLILGMHAQRGFAFIQYETEAQASLAIDREHGSNFHGRKINVKHANVDKGRPGGPSVGGPGGDQQRGGNQRGSFGDSMNRSMNDPPPISGGGGDSGEFGPPKDFQQGGPGPKRDQSGPMGGPNIPGGPNMGRNLNEGGPGGRMGDRDGPMGRNMNESGPNMGRGGQMNDGGPNMGRGLLNDGPPGGPNMGRGPKNDGPPGGPNMGRGPMNDGPNMGRGPMNDGPGGPRGLLSDSPGGPNMGRGLLNDGPNMGRGPMNDGPGGPGGRMGDRDGPGGRMGDRDGSGGRMGDRDGPSGRMGDRDQGGPGNRQGGPDRGGRGGRSNQRGGRDDRDDDEGFDNRNNFGGGGRNRGRGGRGKPYNSRDRDSNRGGRDSFGGRDRDDNQFDNFDPRPDNNRGGPRGGLRGRGHMGGPPGGLLRGGPMGGPMGGDGPIMDGPGFGGPPQKLIPGPPDRADRNDCEIIVVSKQLTIYAEYIEQRLKTLGLVVDLLYPNEDVPIGRVLANISSRGCLFAILIMPQNEENRSLTLNILHGIPQEHRNMPLEDSLLLITRNFDSYMRGEIAPATDDEDTKKLTDRHPDQLQTVFNLLAENRQLSSGQYDRVLKYLEERKEMQIQFELAEGIESDLVEPEVKNKRAELQSRIMNILNKTDDGPPTTNPLKTESLTLSTTTTTAPSAGSSQTQAAGGPTPLLNDPTVQKALDSILLGDMFKGLAGAM